jgi:hypothetical protein
MSAQRRATTPPDSKADMVTNSLRPDCWESSNSSKISADPFGEPPPGHGLRGAQLLSHKVSSLVWFFGLGRLSHAVSSSDLILSGTPGAGSFPL